MKGFFIFVIGVIVGWFLSRIYASLSCDSDPNIRSSTEAVQQSQSMLQDNTPSTTPVSTPPQTKSELQPSSSDKIDSENAKGQEAEATNTDSSKSQQSVDVDTSTENSTKKSSENTKPDKLTLIKGIGPKISKAFIDAGLPNFSDLAELSKEDVIHKLEESNITIVNKQLLQTIPQQAKLAAENDWEKFNELKNSL